MATTGRAVKTVLIPPPRARVVALLTRQLVAQTLCDGKNAACPDAPPMSDGTPCIDRLVLSVD